MMLRADHVDTMFKVAPGSWTNSLILMKQTGEQPLWLSYFHLLSNLGSQVTQYYHDCHCSCHQTASENFVSRIVY